MIPTVISIGGAAFRTSFIMSFTREAWIKDRMNQPVSAWPEKSKQERSELFALVYDLAKPPKKKK